MKKLLFCFFGVLIWGSNIYAEIQYENYPLGMSKSSLHDQLVKDKFYFSEVSENTIKAKKYVLSRFYCIALSNQLPTLISCKIH